MTTYGERTLRTGYRWMVRAQDGAGNTSDWSAPSLFSVNIN